MPEPLHIYAKLLEAQNEQLRESVEKLIIENDELRKKYDTDRLQMDMFAKDVFSVFSEAKIKVINHPTYRRSKGYREVIWSISWTPNHAYTASRLPVLHPMLRKIWLDFLEGSVRGMKWAYKAIENNKPTYRYFPDKNVKFAPTEDNETEKPGVTSP